MNPSWPGLLSTYLVLGGVVAAAAIYRRRSRNSKLGLYLSAAVTVVTILLIFNSLGKLIAGLRPRTFDNVLIAIDHALFGVHPTVWMERMINPLLTAAAPVRLHQLLFHTPVTRSCSHRQGQA